MSTRAGSEPDPVRILAGLGIADAQIVERVEGGMDTSIWRILHNGKECALRVLRPDEADRCLREAEVMRAAQAGGIPTPKILATGSCEGFPVMLLSWLSGRTLVEEVRLHPERSWSLGMEWGLMLARLHSLSPPASPHIDDRLVWSATEDPELNERLSQMCTQSPVLIHLDYHPLNTLTDGVHITGVLDWANACIGDPRMDVARACVILRLARAVETTRRLVAPDANHTLERGLLSGYQEAAGSLRDMALFMAWAWAATARDQAPRAAGGEERQREEKGPAVQEFGEKLEGMKREENQIQRTVRGEGWLQPRHIQSMRRRAEIWKNRAR